MNLSSKSKISPRFSALFTGLKHNTEHNVAITYPLIYLARRIISSMVLVLLFYQAYLAVMAHLVITMIVLAFILIEQPW